MTYTMGAAPSRIRLGDKRQEGQRKLGGKPLIVSPHLGRRGHRRYISRRAYPRHLKSRPLVRAHRQLHRHWIDPGALEPAPKR